jgi:hypothetical protein
MQQSVQPQASGPQVPAQQAQVQQAPSSAAPQLAPAPSQIIYSPRLPSPTELTSVAAAQGMTVEQITQNANQVTAIYRSANGQTSTVAYQLLPTAAPAPTQTVVAPTQTVVVPAPTTVIYEEPRTVYYESYGPAWPRYYYPPVSLSLGFGYYRGWGGGGFHHGHRW